MRDGAADLVAFIGTDGRVHLVCELRLANGFPVPVTVTVTSGDREQRPHGRGDQPVAVLGLAGWL